MEAGEEVVIARADRPVARLVPVEEPRRRTLGQWRGKVWMADSTELSDGARRAIEDPANEVVVSAVSAVEIAIKQRLGKLRAPAVSGRRSWRRGSSACRSTSPTRSRWRRCPGTTATRSIPIVTRDPDIARYQVQIVW